MEDTVMSARTERLPSIVDSLHPTAVRSLDRDRLRHRILIGGLVAGDIFSAAFAFLAAFVIRFHLRITVAPEVIPPADLYAALFLILIPVWLLLFAINGLYRVENLLGGTFEYSKVFHACSVGMMMVVTATFFQPSFIISRGWLVSAWILTIVLTCLIRFLIRRVVYALRRRGAFSIPVLVVGTNGECGQLADQLAADTSAGYRVVGIVKMNALQEDIGTPAGESGAQVLGGIADLVSIIRRHGVRDVIVADSQIQKDQLLAIFERIQPFEHVEMHLSTGLYEVLATGVDLKVASAVPLVRINRLRLRPSQAVIKAAFEWLLAAAVVTLGAPVFLAIAAAVRLTSPGPILHRRRVLGVGGREFDAFKFRTMRIDGDRVLDAVPGLREQLQKEGKLKDDPRITSIGQFLRRYSLDELPQLFNVLRGEMSLVGPRMITAAEAAQYGAHRANLLTVRPGLTGLWQVSGRSELNYAQRVRLDMHYIRHYSIWRDMQILFFQTPGAVLRGRGAY
jgi:exopolysaccharide biosynthesis polyprenyl glycosylphosphotransferase